MYLFFDTETTGFPKKDYTDPENPRLIQLAWALYNKEGKKFKSFCSLVKPDGWEMPSVELFMRYGKTEQEAYKRAEFWIKNGFSQQKSMDEGRPIEHILGHFLSAIEECKYIIAHNMNFDFKIISSEFYRFGLKADNKPIKLCTMESTTNLLKLPFKNNSYKFPSLTELHQFLFNETFDGAHDAGIDMDVLAKCFFELIKNHKFNLPQND